MLKCLQKIEAVIIQTRIHDFPHVFSDYIGDFEVEIRRAKGKLVQGLEFSFPKLEEKSLS
jgi:hypothetical protein